MTSLLRPLSIATLYLTGMLQGLTLVSFPASSAVLRQMHGFSDAQYGAIFLPQVAAAVIGAIIGGGLAARLGLPPLLRIALAVNALSQLLLASTATIGPELALGAVFLGTASLGLAFGVSGAPLNGLPPLLFPRRRDTAIVALHTFLGLGLAVGPILANLFVQADKWVLFPGSLVALALILLCVSLFARFPMAGVGGQARVEAGPCDPMPLPQSTLDLRGTHPVRAATFWMLAMVAVLYAFAEGTFANWAVLYLQEVKQLPEMVAAGALSAFWAAIVAGRLLASVAVLRIPATRIWLALPIVMIAGFLLLPYATTPVLGIGLFALAGMACSAFFPLSIGIASERFPEHVPWVSSMLIAALMVGVGLGSYAVGLLREMLAMESLYRWSTAYPLLAVMLAVLAIRRRAPVAVRPVA